MGKIIKEENLIREKSYKFALDMVITIIQNCVQRFSLESVWVYRYLLTPKGIKEKARITREFVKRKIEKYEKLLDQR